MDHEPSIARHRFMQPAEIALQLRLLACLPASPAMRCAAQGAFRVLTAGHTLDDPSRSPEEREEAALQLKRALAALDGYSDVDTWQRDGMLELLEEAANWIRQNEWRRDTDEANTHALHPRVTRASPRDEAIGLQAAALAGRTCELYAERFDFNRRPDRNLVIRAILSHLNMGGRGSTNRVEPRDEAVKALLRKIGLPVVDRPRRRPSRRNRGAEDAPG
jgi:hypothetical protein